jgi:hypothetical protein
MALSFTGTAHRVNLTAGLGCPSAFSIMAWIHPTTITTLRRLWIWYGNDGIAYNHELYWASSTALEFRVIRAGGISIAPAATGTFSTNKWWFVGATYDDTDGPRMFLGDLTTPLTEVAYNGSRTVSSGAIRNTGETGHIIANAGTSTAFQGRVANMVRAQRRMELEELRAQQWGFSPEADWDMYFELGYQGIGTQPNLTTLGNGKNGTVTSATVGDHVPLMPAWARLDEPLPYLVAGGGGTAWEEEVDDTLTLADQTSASVEAAVVDTATLDDTQAKDVQRTTEDTASLADQTAKDVATQQADTASLADSNAKQVATTQADTATLADAQSKDTQRTTQDTVTPTDASSSAVAKNLDDTTSLADNVSTLLGGGLNHEVPVADTLSLSDLVTTESTYELAIGSTVSLDDAISTESVWDFTIADALTLDDLVTTDLVVPVDESALAVIDGFLRRISDHALAVTFDSSGASMQSGLLRSPPDPPNAFGHLVLVDID